MPRRRALRRVVLLLAAAFVAAPAFAAERTPQVHALLHARVVVEPGRVLDDATLVLRDGIVEAVGPRVAAPADATSRDLRGRTVYPGLVEAWWEEKAAPDTTRRAAGGDNPLVHPEDEVASRLDLGRDEIEELRALGFTLAHRVPSHGIFRGRSAVVALREGRPAEQLVRAPAAHVLAFERNTGRAGRRAAYPGSLMGSVALVRQTLYDAGWARECEAVEDRARGALPRTPRDESAQALSPVLPRWGRERVWARATDVLDVLRVASVVREFELDAVVLGAGDEWRRLDEVRALGLPLVVPVTFPEPPPADDDDLALDVDLAALQAWEQAPANARRLAAAGVRFALTANGLRKRQAFRARVRRAIECGLAPDAALAALTTVPAALLGLESRAGTIAPGRRADFVVADGDLFAPKTRILEVWVEGERHEVRPERDPLEKLRGDWELAAGPRRARLRIEGDEWTLRARLDDSTASRPADAVRWEARELVLRAGLDTLRLRPEGGRLEGTWADARGARLEVLGRKADSEAGSAEKKPESKARSTPPDSIFTWPPLPPAAPPAVLVRGATVWTCGPQGRLADADLLVVGGKVRAVGKELAAPSGAVVVDGRGKHVTPGLIDCHSHSDIIGGVNEATHICTAEVRIGDVLNSESMAIYRELAGGLTAANQLHGSANSIGGQNAVIKLRWGAPPDGLLFAGAPPGIKFALGENPKQSNWGAEANNRYPQTRMGVEQSIRERFLAARDYARTRDDHARGRGGAGLPPRRDLQLDALAEILAGRRLVHCHSYRADEILMMIRVAEEFGFRVGTFQHVLEGYKVADEIAAHGAGASAFSDWWAYKFEVYDAIPYAGALMHERGVVVSFNSDSAELARRLNFEAAKAVKYGGVPEERALEFVTMNPARQLGIESRVGTLEPGKDGDFVLWSDHPLSSATRCEQTWIEGRRYFDRDRDLAARGALLAERRRLVEAARAAGRDTSAEERGASPAWNPSYWQEDGGSCHEVEP